MVEYTIDDIRGPTVAREMAQLKEFVLARFNGAIADAEAAAAAAATAAANTVLANTVKKTGEASQSIAGDVAVTGALDAAAIGSGSTPIVCGDLTAFGNVSLDDTVLQGNLSAADASALIDLDGVGSVLVPDTAVGTYNTNAANAKRVKDELDAYVPMVRTTGNIIIDGLKGFNNFLDLLAGRVEMRVYDDVNRTNQIAGFGVRYRTATSTNASIKSYAPKADPSDPSEIQRGGFLQLVSNRDGTISLNVYGIKSDGTMASKILATFNGTAWS